MTLPTVLSILVESHEDTGAASLAGTFTTKTLDLAIAVDRVVFQGGHLLLPVLVLDLLGRGVLLLFSLLGATVEAEDQVHSRILRDGVVCNQHCLTYVCDECKYRRGEDTRKDRGVYQLGSLSRRVGDQSR
jgi:hypothetical protein